MPEIFLWSLLSTVVQMASGAFLCFFTVRERLRRPFYEVMLVSLLVTVVLFFIFEWWLSAVLGPFPVLLCALFYLWHVADVPKIKLSFILVIAAIALFLHGSLFYLIEQRNEGYGEWIVTGQSVMITVALNAVIVPPVAYLMRTKLWPAMRDMGTAEFRLLLPVALIFFLMELFFSQAFPVVSFTFEWIRVALSATLAAVFFAILVLIITVLRRSGENAAIKAREQRIALEKATLERVSELKSDMIATVSHELRTPLTVMSTHAQLAVKAIEKGEYDNPVLERLHVIVREAKRLSHLSANLLQAFKASGGAQAIAPLCVNEIITQAVSVFGPIMEKNNNHHVLQMAPDLPLVLGNADELTQVLFNLLSNADAHTKNGEIIITAALTQESDFVQIMICDTGSGIEPDILCHIFERSGHDEQGTGYGLVICREIIEAHSGSIVIKSVQGEGTSVAFTLPVYQEGDEDEA